MSRKTDNSKKKKSPAVFDCITLIVCRWCPEQGVAEYQRSSDPTTVPGSSSDGSPPAIWRLPPRALGGMVITVTWLDIVAEVVKLTYGMGQEDLPPENTTHSWHLCAKGLLKKHQLFGFQQNCHAESPQWQNNKYDHCGHFTEEEQEEGRHCIHCKQCGHCAVKSTSTLCLVWQ